METWIQMRQSLPTHKKTRRLVRALNLPYPDGIPQIVGHLCMFWLWCAGNTDNGDLTDLTAQDIADAAAWTGDAETFRQALIDCGFIDTDYQGTCAHDFESHTDKAVIARETDRQRKAQRRQATKPRGEVEPPDPTVDPGWRSVVMAYESNIGSMPTGRAAETLMTYVEDLTAPVVVKAIEITNENQPNDPRKYLKKVLDNWADQGINTVEKAQAYGLDLQRRKEELKRRKQQQNQPNEPPAIQGKFY